MVSNPWQPHYYSHTFTNKPLKHPYRHCARQVTWTEISDNFAEWKKKTTHNPADSNPWQSEYQSDSPTNKLLEFPTASRRGGRHILWAYLNRPVSMRTDHGQVQGQKHHTSLLLNRLSTGIALLQTGMTILYSIAVVKHPWTASTIFAVPLTQLACLTSTGCQPALQ